jgi:cobalt transporter subunit CbtB
MNAKTQATAKSTTSLLSIVFVALVGATVVFAAGLAQSQTLHDAAHDMRHATGFPCH